MRDLEIAWSHHSREWKDPPRQTEDWNLVPRGSTARARKHGGGGDGIVAFARRRARPPLEGGWRDPQ